MIRKRTMNPAFVVKPFLVDPLPHSFGFQNRPRFICPRQHPRASLLTRLESLTERTHSVKCPFWRRRYSDALEVVHQILTWALLTRHKSLLPSPLLAHPASVQKTPHLPVHARLSLIREDFEKRQYYITGRLTHKIYRDDCLFDGPDPDVPVRGLRKYTSATAGLFCRSMSRVDLISIQIIHERCIKAEWRLEGALNLPWRPKIKPYTGCTTYTFDDQNLVQSHIESWSISAFDAFASVLFKGFGAPPAPSIENILIQQQQECE